MEGLSRDTNSAFLSWGEEHSRKPDQLCIWKIGENIYIAREVGFMWVENRRTFKIRKAFCLNNQKITAILQDSNNQAVLGDISNWV